MTRKPFAFVTLSVLLVGGCGQPAPVPPEVTPTVFSLPPEPDLLLPEPLPHPPSPPAALLPEPEVNPTPRPFKEVADVARPTEPQPKQLPAADVPALKPSRLLGHRFNGPPVVGGPMTLSADGKLAAFTVQWPSVEVVLWDVLAGRELWRGPWEQHVALAQLAFSPDGTRLYSGGLNGRFNGLGILRVWDVKAGKPIRTRDTACWSLCGDGKTLATVDTHEGTIDRMDHSPHIPSRSTLTFWNAADFTVKKSFTNVSVGPSVVTLSPDGSRIACGTGNTVTTIDTDTGKILGGHTFQGMTPWGIYAPILSFSPDGKTVAAVDNDHTPGSRRVYLLDTTTHTSRQLVDRATPSEPHIDPLAGMGFTPDGKTLVVGYTDCVLAVNATTGELPPPRDPDPTWTGGRARWSEAEGLKEFPRRGIQPGDMEYLSGFALSADGKTALLGGRYVNDTCALRVVDVPTGKVRYPAKFEKVVPPFPTAKPFLVPSAQDPGRMADRHTELPNKKWVAWDSTIGQIGAPGLSPNSLGYVPAFGVTPDGETLITVGGPGQGPSPPRAHTLRFHDLTTFDAWKPATVPPMPICYGRLIVSPDSRTYTAVPAENELWLWEVATLKPRLRLDTRAVSVYRHTFSPDGRFVMSHDSTVTHGAIWDTFAVAEARKLTDADRAALWADLASDDAAKAYRAIVRFAHDPGASVPFLKESARKLPTVTEPARLAARPFDMGIVTARRAVEALEKCGTRAAAKALEELAEHLPYAAPKAAAARVAPAE